MAESVDGRDEIILRLALRIPHDEPVEHGIVGIGEEDGLDVGIVYPDVPHAVFLFVAAGELVFLDYTAHVVIDPRANDQPVLGLPGSPPQPPQGGFSYGLRVDVIVLRRILYQPPAFLELPEIFGGTLIDTRVVFARSNGEVYFRLDDMVKAHLIVTSLGTRLL